MDTLVDIDPAVVSVMSRMAQRSQAGMKKYGVPIGEYPGDLRKWLVDIQEELGDAMVYIERALMEIDKNR